MRSTQLATLRAIQAGADTFELLATTLRLPLEYARSKALRLRRSGFVQLKHTPSHGNWTLLLTDKSRSLLAERDRVDGAPPLMSVVELFDALTRSLKKG